MAQTILYYPTIDIQDGMWLRNAALYWDGVSSIVPYENYAALSPELLYLESRGLYSPIYPHELFHSEYGEAFTNAAISRLRRCQRDAASPLRETRPARIHAPSLYTDIDYRKIPSALWGWLLDRRLVKKSGRDGWIEMDSRACAIYMRTFAEYAVKCRAEDMVIGTDLPRHQFELYTRTGPRQSAACLSIRLNDCLPQPSMETGFEELLDFKARHQGEFQEFRARLRDFESALAVCENEEELRRETEKFKEAWQLSLTRAEKMFTRERISFTFGTLSALVSAASAAGTAESLLSLRGRPLASAALFGGAAAVSVGREFVNYRNRVSRQRGSAGFSYLLKAAKGGIIRSMSY